MASRKEEIASMTARLSEVTGGDRDAQEPVTTPKGSRSRAMPAEAPKPSEYPARISHATTYAQYDELEDLCKAARRERPDLGALSVTALLRAMTQICLDSETLRARAVREARANWSPRRTA